MPSVAHQTMRRYGVAVACVALVAAATIANTTGAEAEPDVPAPPLPVFTATSTAWAPAVDGRFADRITKADIAAMREMCQWFDAQFDTLLGQIAAVQTTLVAHHDDYSASGVQQRVDAVTANIDQSNAYLTPRADALGESRTCTYSNTLYVCDHGTNIPGGEYLREVVEQQQRIRDGFVNHNPAFINEIAVGRANAAAADVRRRGVCA